MLILHIHGRWKIALVQTVAIIAIAFGIGLVVNAVRSGGIAMIGDWSAKARLTTSTGESLIVSLSEAEKMFTNKAAVFMDARLKQEYDAGHIQGAISIPWHGVEHRFMEVADRIPSDRLIITYCEGETCALSKDLALFLKEMGYEKVHVLVNGWSLWKDAGLPVETG